MAKFRYSRPVRWCQRHVAWRFEGWLLAWTEGADPSNDYEARLLAEDEDGDWLVPAGRRNGEPYWSGYWRWWRPSHWPIYLRSRRARSYVMVERSYD